MPGQIKGITIEFDGATTQLSAALQKIKAEAKGVDSQLAEVNRQLRFDPRNSELLGQKQTLLKQKIEDSKNALAQFRDVEKQLTEQKVDRQSEAFMKVRREIIAAQGKLRAYNAQLAKADWSKVKNFGNDLTKAGQKMTRLTRYARLAAAAVAGITLYKGLERLKSLDEVSKQLEVLGYRGKKLDGIMEDVSGSVEGTRFMLQDMAKVASGALGSGVTDKYQLNEYLGRTADLAQLAGIDVQSMGAMLNKAYSKGKVDAKIMNQLNSHGIPIYKLMQKELGVTADELQEMSKKGKLSFDDLYRATNKYQGLAQKMGTETLPGALTVLQQQFGLIGADFLSGVYEPLKEGTKGIVAAIKQMRKEGTFKEWGKDLGDTVKYFVTLFKDGEASMSGMSDRAQNLVSVLTPLLTTIKTLIDLLAKLPPEMQGLLVLMTLFGGPMLTAAGTGVKLFADMGMTLEKVALNAQAGVGPITSLTGGTNLMTGAVSALLSPLGLATLGIGAWALGVKKAYDEEHRFTQGYEEWKTASDGKLESVEAEGAMIDLYKTKLDELIGKEKKSASDKALIKQYVEKLNGAVAGLNLKYDEEEDKLNKTSRAIEKKIQKYKEAALVKAYEDLITEAAKKEAEAQLELEKLYEKREKIQKKWNETADKSAVAEQGYKMALGDVNREIEDAKEAVAKYDEEMNRSAKAVEKLSDTTDKEMKKGTKSAKKEGSETPKQYASGIKKGEERVRNASKKLADAAEGPLDIDTKKLGQDFGEGYKSGIMSKVRDIATAAGDMVKSAIKAARKAQDSGSPSKIMRKVGRDYGTGYMLGINDEAQPVFRAAHNMVAGAIGAATVPTHGMSLNQAEPSRSIQETNNREIVNNITVYSNDGRQFARDLIDAMEQEARAY